MSAREIPGPYGPGEIRHFPDRVLSGEEAGLLDEVLRLAEDEGEIEARMDTTRSLPFADHQRVNVDHPAHVSAGELIMLTGVLGCLHAWFFHGCRWDEGWAGFGNRIHRADFKSLAGRGPDLRLLSRETRTRIGERRVVLRYTFEFRQQDRLVYLGDQTAMFVKGKGLGA